MDRKFVDKLLFCAEREAQEIVDKYYPGWKVKVGAGNVGLIYDPNGVLVHKIVPKRDKSMNKVMDRLERKFL